MLKHKLFVYIYTSHPTYIPKKYCQLIVIILTSLLVSFIFSGKELSRYSKGTGFEASSTNYQRLRDFATTLPFVRIPQAKRGTLRPIEGPKDILDTPRNYIDYPNNLA